jgi:hypothetical protein
MGVLPNDPALHKLTFFQRMWLVANAVRDRQLTREGSRGSREGGVESVKQVGGMTVTTRRIKMLDVGLEDDEFDQANAANKAKAQAERKARG